MLSSYNALIAENMPRMKRAAAIIVSMLAFSTLTASGLMFPNPFSFVFTSVSVAVLASLIFAYRSNLILLLPVASGICVIAVTGSPVCALVSLASLVPSVALAVLFYKKARRSSAVTAVSIVVGISFAVVVGVMLLMRPELISRAASVKSLLTEKISSLTVNTANGRVLLYTEEAAESLAAYFVVSIPAAVIIVINAISFVSSEIFLVAVKMFGFWDRVPDGKWRYSPELAAAIVYISAYVVSASLIPFPSADVVGFAAENVLIALIPAMLIAGERALLSLSQRHDKKTIFIVLSAMLFLVSPSLYLMVITFSGAVAVIISRIKPYVMRFIRRDGD